MEVNRHPNSQRLWLTFWLFRHQAWNRPIGGPVVREKLAAVKLPLLSKTARVEPPSHTANVGPVPLFLAPCLFPAAGTRDRGLRGVGIPVPEPDMSVETDGSGNQTANSGSLATTGKLWVSGNHRQTVGVWQPLWQPVQV
jgi:hypothetical protein